MKHAGEAALEQLTERKRGTFYRKSSAFLHFHEDPEGLFADLKIDGTFQRFRVSTARERAALVRKLEGMQREALTAAVRKSRPPR